jgi:hypothetical protein
MVNIIVKSDNDERLEWEKRNPPPIARRDNEGRPVIDDVLIDKQTAHRHNKDAAGVTTEAEYQRRKELAQRMDR